MNKDNKFPKINDYIILFILFANFGWLYETFLEVVVYGWGFSNRGMLFGPYLPIYGVGGLASMLLFYHPITLNKKMPLWLRMLLFFLGVVVIGTIIELVASYLLEWFTGSWPWQNYDSYAFNFGGRVALNTSIRFGLLALTGIYTIVPLEKYISERVSTKSKNITAICIIALIAVETIFMIIGFIK